MSTIDLKVIQQKLYEGLKPSGWADKLKGFILSDEFYKILLALYGDVNNGKRFTPILKQVFRAFEECPYSELKIVMIAQDPYPKAGEADGIAFSCANTTRMQLALRVILEEVDRTVYGDEQYADEFTFHLDLARWSRQGILMLNTALTTRTGTIGTHGELWKPFITYLLDFLNHHNTGLVYVFMGNEAKNWRTQISSNNFKFFTTYPSSAAYTKEKHWDSGNLFNQINKILLENYKFQITW